MLYVVLLRTPPFSSEEEADEDDVKQPYKTPEILQKQSKPSSSIVHAFQKPSGKSHVDGMEKNETEETATPAKTSKGFLLRLHMDIYVTTVHGFAFHGNISVLENIMKADYLVLSVYVYRCTLMFLLMCFY